MITPDELDAIVVAAQERYAINWGAVLGDAVFVVCCLIVGSVFCYAVYAAYIA